MTVSTYELIQRLLQAERH